MTAGAGYLTTYALVGAGPGLGPATVRRFGAAGHSVALPARSAEHLDDLVAETDALMTAPAEGAVYGSLRFPTGLRHHAALASRRVLVPQCTSPMPRWYVYQSSMYDTFMPTRW